MILAGDIGGTRTRLALYERRGAALEATWKQTVLNAGHASFASALATCLTLADASVKAVVLGVAGPVEDGVCRMTNLDWVLDERVLQRALGAPLVIIVNDLTAAATGVTQLPEDSFAILHEGSRRWGDGSMAVVAPGTGLGEAGLLWDGARHLVVPSESGHTDFAPATAMECELHAYLAERFGHVSWEHVLSGPGLANLAAFLGDTGRATTPPALRDAPPADRPALIAELALARADPLCAAALDMFASVLGRECGNAGLRYVATGGICLAGGIPPAILPVLRQQAFMKAVVAKGRMGELAATLPVRVAMDVDAGLLGAAHIGLAAIG
ncbi:MAG: glucokinase [Alphaproteobacteria bacterium]|nr:glucokinase [Alphaproteobacteria bacterium]